MAALAAVMAGSALSSGQVSGDPGKTPNVLIMIADNLGQGDLKLYKRGALGITKNIDELGRSGVVFSRFYTASAICSPSRVGIATGVHPAHLGIYSILHQDDEFGSAEDNFKYNLVGGIPEGAPTLYQFLKEQGYRTGHFGKWHIGSLPGFGPNDRGVDTHFVHATTRETEEKRIDLLFRRGPRAYFGERDTLFTSEAVRFIKSAAREDRPFVATISFYAPHQPLFPRDNLLSRMQHLGDFVAPRHREMGFAEPRVSPAQIYYASILGLDNNIGRLIDALKVEGIYDNTLVVFLSDNGIQSRDSADTSASYFGDNGFFRGTGHTIYEGGIRVPLVIAGPGVAKGYRTDDVVSGLDLVPTIVKLIAGNVPEGIDGEDISDALGGKALSRRSDLFWISINNRSRREPHANRSPALAAYDAETGMKCLMNPDGSRKEAYLTPMGGDTAELVNLARDPAHRKDVDTCLSKLARWFERLPRPVRFMDGAGALYKPQ